MISYLTRDTVNAQDQRLVVPNDYVPGSRRGVLMFAGAGGTAHTWYSSGQNAVLTPKAITDRGVPTASVAVDMTWGNTASQTGRATPLRNTAIAAGLFKNDDVIVLGSSMGGALALNWARANPTLVAGIVLTIPLIDIQLMHSTNAGGNAASIAAAWGGGAPSDANNPADNAAAYTSIPMVIYASTDDTLVPYATAQTFATAAGAELRSMGAVGHNVTDPAIPGQIADWIAARA